MIQVCRGVVVYSVWSFKVSILCVILYRDLGTCFLLQKTPQYWEWCMTQGSFQTKVLWTPHAWRWEKKKDKKISTTVNYLLFTYEKILWGSGDPKWCEYFLLRTSYLMCLIGPIYFFRIIYILIAKISVREPVYLQVNLAIRSSLIKVGLQYLIELISGLLLIDVGNALVSWILVEIYF